MLLSFVKTLTNVGYELKVLVETEFAPASDGMTFYDV
jgi:hypothetical protein